MNHEERGDGLLAEGEIFDGGYRILRVLGTGEMATVVAATRLGFDERVAIKILLPECSGDLALVERFLEEGKLAAKIRSEHAVRILGSGVVCGRAYLVMEYLEGNDLEALLDLEGPVSFPNAVDLLLQACEAIGEARALGVVHRDLKPANLFVARRRDGSICVKVLDFGISKVPRGGSALPSPRGYADLPAMVMGSPLYMSPEEIATATRADPRSDIWALGAILYELLTGLAAFGGGATSEICRRVLRGSPVPIVQLRGDVPGELETVVFRCLEKDPSRRYPNVAALARALAPFGTARSGASADWIARVVEGGIEGRSCWSGAAAVQAISAREEAR